jgi:Fe-S-cluster containining protein
MYHLFYKRKELTAEEEQEVCKKCQFCCRYMIEPLNADNYRVEFINTWGGHRLITNGSKVYTIKPFACRNITDDGCKIYESRPQVCRNFKGGDTADLWKPFCLLYEHISEDEKFEMLRKMAPSPIEMEV